MVKKISKRIIWVVSIMVYLCLFGIVTYNYTNSNRYFDFEVSEVIEAKQGEEIVVDVGVKNKTYYDISSKKRL